MASKIELPINVFTAARERISWAFDRFEKVCISFSGGKDSTVMTHLVMGEAKLRKRKVGLFFIDWEAQFDLTIDFIREIYTEYADHIIPLWVQLPLVTNNSCSMFEPLWKPWDQAKKDLWIRPQEPGSIKEHANLPFFYDGIEWDEFLPLFSKWFSEGKDTAFFIGIRTDESLNRYRAIARDKRICDGKKYTTNVIDNVWNVYPIYDWAVEDDWLYLAKHKKSYNPLYDRMHQAGMTVHAMRIDEPFGEEPRKALWLYQVVEPATWARMLARFTGINSGALYCKENGSVLGNMKISLPAGHTWESFASHLLNSMPPKLAEHYKNKISVYLKWYEKKGFGIHETPEYIEMQNRGEDCPSWRLICKTLLKNDYWCRGMGFAVTKSSAYETYMKRMQENRKTWDIFPETTEGISND